MGLFDDVKDRMLVLGRHYFRKDGSQDSQAIEDALAEFRFDHSHKALPDQIDLRWVIKVLSDRPDLLEFKRDSVARYDGSLLDKVRATVCFVALAETRPALTAYALTLGYLLGDDFDQRAKEKEGNESIPRRGF